MLQRYGDIEQAKRSLQEYESISERFGYARKLTSISPHLGMLAYNSGDFDKAIHHFSDSLTHHWDRFTQREKLLSQIGNAMLARIHYERNELDLAVANIDAIGTAHEQTFIEICEAKTISLARCWLAQGKYERSLNLLTESAHRATLAGMHNLATMISATQVNTLLLTGKLMLASELAEKNCLFDIWEREAKPARVLWALLEPLLRALVPLLINQQQADIAAKIAADFSNLAASQGRHYMLALGLIYQAKSVIAQTNEEKALTLLAEAISHTTELAIIRPYIDAGSDILLLLEKVIPSLHNEKEITHIQDINSIWNSDLKTSRTSTILTKREHDVLTELSKGHPTKVIARNLDLSPETIKHHLKHIYAKLNVGNRKEAVTEAWRMAMFS